MTLVADILVFEAPSNKVDLPDQRANYKRLLVRASLMSSNYSRLGAQNLSNCIGLRWPAAVCSGSWAKSARFASTALSGIKTTHRQHDSRAACRCGVRGSTARKINGLSPAHPALSPMRPLHQSLSPLMYYLLGEVIFVSPPMFLKGEQIFSKTICHYDCVRAHSAGGVLVTPLPRRRRCRRNTNTTFI